MLIDFNEVRRVVNERSDLLNHINEAMKSLNKDFASNPMRLDTKSINALIKNLMEINRDLNNKKEAIEDKGDKWWKYISPVSITTISLQTISWASLTVLGIWSVSSRKQRDCEDVTQGVSTIAISSFGIFLTTVLGFGIKAIDEDRDQRILLSRIQKIEDNGEERFLKFLNTFEEFKNSQTEKKDLETQKEFLKKCIVSFSKMPKKGYKRKLPPRDNLTIAMLQMLPNEDPLKRKYEQLKRHATQILDSDEESSISSRSSPSESTSEEESSPSLSSSNDSSDDSSDDSFEGEQLAFRDSYFRAKTSEFSIEDNDSPLPKDQLNVLWKDLESGLGLKIKKMDIGNYIIDQSCKILEKKMEPTTLEFASDSFEITVDY